MNLVKYSIMGRSLCLTTTQLVLNLKYKTNCLENIQIWSILDILSFVQSNTLLNGVGHRRYNSQHHYVVA